MLDDYKALLESTRTPERAEGVLKLVELLYDTRYDVELNSIVGFLSGSDVAHDVVLQVEDVIIRCAVSLFNRLGIDVDVDGINADMESTFDLLECILRHVEDFDDYDTMMAIMSSGDSPVLVYADLCSFITGNSTGSYTDILIDVSARTIRAMTGVLTVRQMASVDSDYEIDITIARQVIAYLKMYPSTPISEVLGSYGYLQTLDQLVQDVDIPYDPNVYDDDYVQNITLAIAGIALTQWKTFDDAYPELETLAAMVLDDAQLEKRYVVAKHAADMIENIYNTLEPTTDSQEE